MIRKLAYSAGGIATALSYQTFSAYIIFFYVDVVKLPAYLAGIAMLVYGIWNAVNDPLAGYLSDRTQTRFGRRLPFIALGALPLGLAYYFLWTPPFTGLEQTTPLFIYFLALICIFDGIYTFVSLNWLALFPEMFAGTEERAGVNSLRQAFTLLGLFIGISLPPLIYGGLGWRWLGTIFGIIIAGVFLLSLAGIREKKPTEQVSPLRPVEALKTVLKNRAFRIFVLANMLVQYGLTLMLATLPFFAKYVLKIEPQQAAAFLVVTFLAALPLLFYWKKLTVKHGSQAVFRGALALLAAASGWLFFSSNLNLVLVLAAGVGAGVAGFIMTNDLLLSEVIDEDELNSGLRNEGLYFGATAFINRLAIGLEAVSLSLVFVLSGYNPYIHTQSNSFQLGVKLLVAGLPFVAFILGYLVIGRFPLSLSQSRQAREKGSPS